MEVKTLGLLLLTITLVLSICNVVSGAVAHTHSHKRSPSPSRERESDGAFSPRDLKHHDEGGHHRAEFDHEAILGSAKEAEEFDNLPPEEAKKRLQVLVERMDLNKDNIIERGELKAWIMRSFKLLSEEEASERFEEIDENEDGQVTWPEYIEETYGVSDESSAIPLQDLEEQRMLSDDKALYNAADKNRDGHLDRKEILSFTHPEEDPDMLPIIYQQTLKERDFNGDGLLDFKEYIGDRGKDKDKEWLEGEKDRFDNEYDKNKDGLLDRHEILSWVVPSNEEIAEEEVTHLFAAADDDHDDVLTYEEILDHHDVFVGSEATDYGEHLQNLDRFKDEL
ncbi:Reticulocalbin-2 [Orchesella cincta]|uniref:Reticulocalbin-3 n=1 Tax=Orchesella cincta TaxID=48709 RepID=A0A1D2MRU2_ORCCI|nr:Reticulocalbin-2 [Orchesella cincta]